MRRIEGFKEELVQQMNSWNNIVPSSKSRFTNPEKIADISQRVLLQMADHEIYDLLERGESDSPLLVEIDRRLEIIKNSPALGTFSKKNSY